MQIVTITTHRTGKVDTYMHDGMTVRVTEAPAVVTAADLDGRGYEANADRLDELAKSHYRPIPFWQNGAATVGAKNALRALLARHAGTETAELVRWILNDMRAEGALIERSTVETYTRLLKSL